MKILGKPLVKSLAVGAVAAAAAKDVDVWSSVAARISDRDLDRIVHLAVKEECQAEIVVGWRPIPQQFDGALVGGASLRSDSFVAIARALAAARTNGG